MKKALIILHLSSASMCWPWVKKTRGKWNVISSWWAEIPLIRITGRELTLTASIKNLFFSYLLHNTMNQCLQRLIRFLSIPEWEQVGWHNYCWFIVCIVHGSWGLEMCPPISPWKHKWKLLLVTFFVSRFDWADLENWLNYKVLKIIFELKLNKSLFLRTQLEKPKPVMQGVRHDYMQKALSAAGKMMREV